MGIGLQDTVRTMSQVSISPVEAEGSVGNAVRPRHRAWARVAVPLDAEARQRLQAFVNRLCGEPVPLEIIIDREVLGGVWLRVDDTVIDGSLRGKLDELRHHLLAQSRLMLSPSDLSG